MTDKFNIIYADPPWEYRDKGKAGKRGASQHYDDLPLEKMQRLDVSSIAAKDCSLLMWCTLPMLPDGLELMKAWGFEYRTTAFVWIKTPKGKPPTIVLNRGEVEELYSQKKKVLIRLLDYLKLFWGGGQWTRSNFELVLFGVRGKPKRVSKSVHNVVIHEHTGRHSGKPPVVRDKIVQLLGELPRCELFARDKVDGWSSWGNEVECDFELTFREDEYDTVC